MMQQGELSRICALRQATVRVGDPVREVTVSNHNRLLSLYPYAIGLKTGYTVKSGKCLVSAAEKDGVTLIAVSLNGGDYWNDHIALYEYGFSLAKAYELTVPALPSLAVAGGTAQRVALQTETPGAAVLLSGEQERVQCVVQLPAFVWAPVEAGETVGTITYKIDDRVLDERSILAAESIAARSPQTYFQKSQREFLKLLRKWIG